MGNIKSLYTCIQVAKVSEEQAFSRPLNTYNKVPNDKCWQEEQNGQWACGFHAVPQRFNPLATQNSKHHHESVPKVVEIPSRYVLGIFRFVSVTKNLYSSDSEYIDDNSENQCDVTNGSDALRYRCHQLCHGFP